VGRSKSPRSLVLSALRELLGKRFPEDAPLLPYPFGLEQPETDFEDRAMVLIGCSIIEQFLEDCILTHFANLDENEKRDLFSAEVNAPLSNFANKINLAYALKVIGSSARSDLIMIKSIRNVFAHTFEHIDFKSKIISDACFQISISDRIKIQSFEQAKTDSKYRFKISSTILMAGLSGSKEEKPFLYTDKEHINLLS
jgi:DNA-binding MltR family transcriptional regulator